jgi:hypothetical protein
MSTRAAEYLVIPDDYAAALGLRWSYTGDAVLHGHGQTFAFAQQIWQFLEGFMSVRPPLHFAHTLHLMHLMGLGSIGEIETGAVELRRAVLQAGRPLRNAGVFCAHLCRNMPESPLHLEPLELRQELYHRTDHVVTPPEAPALEPAEFQRQVFAALASYSADELLHWLKLGQSPQHVAERLAEEIERRPPNVEAALARAAENRERLAEALALVPALNGALTLPPRRLDERELPVGGYADVTTRGEPERLLPTQYALESDEFIRRFAEHELLFFRREEPGRPTQEELVIVLDQGVRTWGGVRLALAGAVFAFAHLAHRRGIPLRLATTGNKGRPIDPITAGAAALGALLEASDLTANPVAALSAVLDVPSERLRDVVLLTHPRSLTDRTFAAIAAQERAGDRLFAVSIDSQGRGQLDQVRDGRPVALSHFRLDLLGPQTLPARSHPAKFADPAGWTGDVEPVPFPFWFGPVKGVRHLAFDRASEWLLATTNHGLLHLQKLDGTCREILPRGYARNQVLHEIDAVLGVTGGFVVCGKLFQTEDHAGREVINLRPVAFHYDLRTRRVAAHGVPEKEPQSAVWFSFLDLHAIACRTTRETWGIDLATGLCHPVVGGDQAPRAKAAAERARRRSAAAPHVVQTGERLDDDVWYDFDTARGTIEVYGPEGEVESAQPLSDGRPTLRGAVIRGVQQAGAVLAVLAHRPSDPNDRLLILRGPDGDLAFELVMLVDRPMFHLSRDGRFVAVPGRPNDVEVYELSGAWRFAAMPAGKCHTNVEVELGRHWLAVRIGKLGHLFRWDRGDLELLTPANNHYRDGIMAVTESGTAGRPSELSPLTRYDAGRFLKRVAGRLRVEVDRFGHVVILDAAGERLVAIFWFRRDKAAAWLPDGTRWGAAEIVGTPSPDAAAKVAQALRGS